MKDKTFESEYNRMIEIMNELENGDISLDETVKLFEEASKLYDFCLDKLNEAKLKITKISEKDENKNEIE